MIKFEKIREPLVELLELFENNEYHDLGIMYSSGGFACAEYDYMDDYNVYITLTWGVQNDVEDKVSTEHYKISISILTSAITTLSKLKFIQNG